MHELSLALSLVEEVERILEREHAARALGITLAIGPLSGVEREALEFCFPMVIEGTRCAGAKLKVHEPAVVVACGACGGRGAITLPSVICPLCGGSTVEIVAGREFNITALEVE